MLIERGLIVRQGDRWVATTGIERVEIPDTPPRPAARAHRPAAQPTRDAACASRPSSAASSRSACSNACWASDGSGGPMTLREGGSRRSGRHPRGEGAHPRGDLSARARVPVPALARPGRRLRVAAQAGAPRSCTGEVGEALETLYPDRRGELAGMLAMHFEQAGETEKAIDYYLADARYGLARNAIHESFAAAGAALRLMGPPSDDEPSDRRRARVELTVLRVRASMTFRAAAELLAELDSVVDVAEASGDADLAAQVYLWIDPRPARERGRRRRSGRTPPDGAAGVAQRDRSATPGWQPSRWRWSR